MSDTFSNTERQAQILALLQNDRRVSVSEICAHFAISEATARRDLETLAEQGQIKRVHGGAILVPQAPPEAPILQRQGQNAEEKHSIAQAAAALIESGETVFLGSGTTVLEVARSLRQHQNLTIITNSLPVINTLAGLSTITLIALGGVLRESELSFIGHITEQALAEVRADKVVMGVHAIHLEHGLTNDYLPETMTDRAILKAGREVIVVADHTKINTVATAFLAPLEAIHTFITDSGIPPDFLDALKAKGVRVLTP
jgi:DeoR/GlpR family transcriptional regulator of sugar metabolism